MNVELPRTQVIYDDYKARGLALKTIWSFDNINTIKYYARVYTYPHFEDRSYAAWNQYNFNGSVPLNYVIDTAGVVVGEMVGWNESTIRTWIESSLTGISENTKEFKPIENFSIAPNPAKTVTSIKFSLTKSEHVVSCIYSCSGKLVKTLFDGNLPAGINCLNWNLRDNAGNTVANGVYIYELITATGSVRTKVSVLK
jgi:FlgD Ig-like domain